jgi:hypothetical protein
VLCRVTKANTGSPRKQIYHAILILRPSNGTEYCILPQSGQSLVKLCVPHPAPPCLGMQDCSWLPRLAILAGSHVFVHDKLILEAKSRSLVDLRLPTLLIGSVGMDGGRS